jgi:hypothetical protein
MTDQEIIWGLLKVGGALVLSVWAGLFLVIFIDQLFNRNGRR